MMLSLQSIYQRSKYRLALCYLAATVVVSLIAHFTHWYQEDPFDIHKTGSILTILLSLVCLVWLFLKPGQLNVVTFVHLALVRLLMTIASFSAIYLANASERLRLVEFYPPFTVITFVWMALVVIYIPYEYLLWFLTISCVSLSVPVLWYLLVHVEEFQTARGTDLFTSYGVATLIYAVLGVFYARLQVNFQTLLQERLTNYTQIIEAQDIRQSAIADLFTQLHNGALQTLALLSRELQQHEISSKEITSRLETLNQQIRSIADLESDIPIDSFSITQLRLAAGVSLDLDLPFHTLAYEVYRATLAREFPYFRGLKIKVRSFEEIEADRLTPDLKREIGFWLEEALCNVGKHAEAATQLKVTGRIQDREYILSVQNNGQGIRCNRAGQGTKQSQAIAKKLGGTFRRENLAQGGVLCELRWFLDVR